MGTLDVAPRLLGKFVVPPDLSIGGTPVGGLSGVGRDRRSGRHMMISDPESRRFYEAETDLRFTKVQFLHRRERADPDEIRVDPRTGNLVWSHDGPGCDPIVIDPFTGDGPVLKSEDGEDDAKPQRAGEKEDPRATLLLPDVAPERPYVISFETRECVTSTQPQLTEGVEAQASGRRLGLDGTGLVNVGEVATLRSVLGAPILTVRLTLLADLADRGVPDPDNFEGMTQGPDLPPGERTPLRVSDTDLKEELRARAVALAIPPKPL